MAKSILSWDWGGGSGGLGGGSGSGLCVCFGQQCNSAEVYTEGSSLQGCIVTLTSLKRGKKNPNQKRLTCRVIKHSPAFVSLNLQFLFNNPCAGLQRKMIWIMIKSKSTYIPPSRLTQFRIFSTAKWDDPQPTLHLLLKSTSCRVLLNIEYYCPPPPSVINTCSFIFANACFVFLSF